MLVPAGPVPGGTLRAVDRAAFAALAPAWRDVEARVHRPHYAQTHAWLSAWIDGYAPARLLHVEIAVDGRRIAVGLLERGALGQLRFAGQPVSPRCGLVVADGREIEAWAGLGRALAEAPLRWSALHCVGAPRAAGALARAAMRPTPEYSLELPADFDDYLESLSSAARKSMRQKLRRVARAADVVEIRSEDHPRALAQFLRLHGLRAAARGERHAQIDDRLAALLLRLGDGIALRVFELRVDGAAVASSVRLDDRGTAFFYNGGFDPAFSRLSPGISLELASIRDAIGRGLGRFDLGPGDYRYKTDLGGSAEARYSVTAPAPGARAGAIRTLRAARIAVSRLRR